jgi:hypothetical protein
MSVFKELDAISFGFVCRVEAARERRAKAEESREAA